MKVTITGRKVNLRDNFKELVLKKLSRYERIFHENAEANVVVTLERNRQTVEVTIHDNGMLYRAEATDFEMNDALDVVVRALGRQIRKNKTRLQKQLHTTELDEYVADISKEDAADNVEDESEYNVVRTKHFFVKPLSVEEAILQMNLIGHQFFMFRDINNGEIQVVYKRKDGNYGLLEPDAG